MRIEPSAAIRNNYNQISEPCKRTGEGDFAVIDIEAVRLGEELLKLREELLAVGVGRDVDAEEYTFEEAVEELRKVIDEVRNENGVI